MQASWSTAITGCEVSRPRPDPRGSAVASRDTPYRSAGSSSMLSPVVVCFGSASRGGWSVISGSVRVARQRRSSSLVVRTAMPSSQGRTQAAVKTRAPVSTTHIRHTPTGS